VRRIVAATVTAALGLGLAAVGCAPAVDPAKLAAVQVAGPEVTLRGCRLLGPVEGKDSDRWVQGGPRLETAMLDLRKKAVIGGGNTLVTDSIEPPRDTDYTPTFTVRARLFSCSAEAQGLAAAPSPSPPGSSVLPAPSGGAPGPKAAPEPHCEPDCSPGYTCLRGTCVSACNPRCGANERCAADRVCHPVAALPGAAPLPP
jgi:hypothetical protein